MDPASTLATAKKIEEGLKWTERLWRAIKKLRYPKPKSGAEGIVIAFDAEDDIVDRQIKNDLIHTLRKLASSGNPERPLQIIELPTYHIEKIKDISGAERALHNCASKLIFWGQAKKRPIEGKVTTILEMNALVSHQLIVARIGEVFAKEMAELLPPRLLAVKENELIEMEFNAVGLDLASHYIIATASFFSDIPYSLQLFQKLQEKLAVYNASHLPPGLKSHIALLKKKVQINITFCLLELSQREHMSWRLNKDNLEPLKASYKYALQAEAIVPNLYPVAIAASIYHFVVEGNAKKARKVLESWPSRVTDATWAFNTAFLHAFDGNLSAAARFYKVSFRRDTSSQTQFEIEEFLEWVMAKYPEKYQLHYCMGMFQLFTQNNAALALTHFRRFLDAVSDDEYSAQVKDVNKYLDPSFNPPKTSPLK